jgi:cation diffusion facilitator CzcD-associated flavoprotein CzcO
LTPQHRVVIVGTGFGGLGAAIQLKRAGISDFVVLERSSDVGGTWRENSYPGCACDVPSHLYSFSFDLNPNWSRSFSPQSEIWDYLRRSAAEAGVLPHVRFGTAVTEMRYSEADRTWLLDTSNGPVTARFVIAAVGGLSEPLIPELPGLKAFKGAIFHSAAWDHSFDLTAKRVAVVGTGASSIQFVPQIQPSVSKLVLFQRTAPWVLPRRDRSFGRAEKWLYRTFPIVQRAARAAIYWGRELYVLGFTRHRGLMRYAEAAALRHLAKQVPDPELRAKLTPTFTMGCKRILLASDYYPALTRDNVEVLNQALAEVKERSVVAADGSEHQVDAIIFGTGFHVTDFPVASRIFGRGDVSLEKAWADTGMQAYKGTTVKGFPNLFILTGPNTGLGHTSVVFMMESQLAYVLDCLRHMDLTGSLSVEVRPEAQERFNLALQKTLAETVWNSGGCQSWYLDSNGRNTTLWPGFTFEFRRLTRRFDPDAYELEGPSLRLDTIRTATIEV